MCCSVLCSEKGKKQGHYMWDTGPQSVEAQKTSKPRLFPVANKSSQPGIVIVAAHSQCCNPHLYDSEHTGGVSLQVYVFSF